MDRAASPSRLNPFYLASRHAGMCFFLVALGFAAGMAWRCLFQPTRHAALARAVFSVSPPGRADGFDWSGGRWRAMLANPYDQGLLMANLRHVVKLAATRGAGLDAERLSAELSLFRPARRYSTLLLDNRLPSWLTKSIDIARDDIAANMDFQSLAAVASDLDPPQGASGWDFSFFDANPGGGLESAVIVSPGPGDRCFRVFYLLHELVRGRPASSPEEAWRAAVEEVSARLGREADFAGGGGFGSLAGRELMREIAAIPALAANRLYHAALWSGDPSPDRASDDSFRMRRVMESFAVACERRGGAEGVLSAGMALDLHPLGFPRDTVLTRIPPLATATLLAYVAASEKNALPEPAPPETVAPPAPVPDPEPSPPSTSTEATAIVDVVPTDPVPAEDREADARRKDRVLALEERLRRARIDRDSEIRRLEAAREAERNLMLEALAARERSDRLGERSLDSSGSDSAMEREVAADPEAARLLSARNIVVARLAALLQTCTEEHPFVRAARRELATIDSFLSNLSNLPKTVAPVRDAEAVEAGNVRLSRMRAEWERAKTEAAELDARRRRLSDSGAAILEAVSLAEDRIASAEAELARIRNEPAMTRASAAPDPVRAPVVEPAAVPTPVAEPEPEPRPEPEMLTPIVAAFQAAPADLPAATVIAPSWDMPVFGGLLGLCLALLRVLSCELAAGRFDNANQAQRMVRLPLLAALPAYDAKSFRAAAASARGEVFGSKSGKMTFIPLPVDFAEPKPAARRGVAPPARRLPAVGAWAAGILLLGIAGALVSFSARGFARPEVSFPDEMRLPAAADPGLSGPAGAAEGGNGP